MKYVIVHGTFIPYVDDFRKPFIACKNVDEFNIQLQLEEKVDRSIPPEIYLDRMNGFDGHALPGYFWDFVSKFTEKFFSLYDQKKITVSGPDVAVAGFKKLLDAVREMDPKIKKNNTAKLFYHDDKLQQEDNPPSKTIYITTKKVTP